MRNDLVMCSDGNAYIALQDNTSGMYPPENPNYWTRFVARGAEGPQGEKGETGEQGPVGKQGSQGEQGPQGERGEKGEQGERGEVGLQGVDSNTGQFVAVMPNYSQRSTLFNSAIPVADLARGTWAAQAAVGSITMLGNGFVLVSVMGTTSQANNHNGLAVYVNGAAVDTSPIWANPTGTVAIRQRMNSPLYPVRAGDTVGVGTWVDANRTGSVTIQVLFFPMQTVATQGPVGPIGPQGERGEQGLQGPRGEQGIQGETGPAGPPLDLRPRGIWNAGTQYARNDIVSFFNSATGTQNTYWATTDVPLGASPAAADYWQLLVMQGEQGLPGAPGPANTLAIGTVSTGGAGSNASAAITGTSPNQTLNLTIPQGQQGSPGPANTLTIGTVSTGGAGTQASATITGTSPNQTLNLTIPRGDTGSAGSIVGLAPLESPNFSGNPTAPLRAVPPEMWPSHHGTRLRVPNASSNSQQLATEGYVLRVLQTLNLIVFC